MVKYDKSKSFKDNMDDLFAGLEEWRKEHLRLDEDEHGNRIEEQDQTDKWVVEVIEHVQNGIDKAKILHNDNPVEAVCEVANAIVLSLCDEINFGGVLKMVRTGVFGYDDGLHFEDAFHNIGDYTNSMFETVGLEKIMKVERRCTRCHAKYWFYVPSLWNDGRDAKTIRSDTRRTNTNASYEFMCLSGMCDACWQVCFNKEEEEG